MEDVPAAAARREDDVAVGLIGFGLAGAAFHAPLIATTPGLRLAAVVTRDAGRAAQARSAYPGVAVVDAPERLWERGSGVGLVVVATPNRTHVPLAMAAVEAGVPVVVDKPLAASAADARRLADEAARRGVMLSVYQNRRWDGDFLTARRLIAEGALGDVVRWEARFERWRPVPRGGWRERAAPEEAGGLLFDLGSHLIDQALLLFGPARSVYAELDRRRPGAEVDDDGFVALEHASGVRSHLWTSAVAAQAGPGLRVLGSRAAYTKWGTDVQEAALRRGERPGPGWGEEPEERWGWLGAGDRLRRVRTEPGDYPRFYAGIAEALRVGTPPPVDPRDAVAVLEVIEAAFRSAAEGRVVRVEAAGSDEVSAGGDHGEHSSPPV
jgi:predicted dehydrogenase